MVKFVSERTGVQSGGRNDFLLFLSLSYCMDLLPYACITFIMFIMCIGGIIYLPSLSLWANIYFPFTVLESYCTHVIFYFSQITYWKKFLNHYIVLYNMICSALPRYHWKIKITIITLHDLMFWCKYASGNDHHNPPN